MRWGLVPRWWSKTIKDVKMATFNARAETVETKPFFRDAFKRTRRRDGKTRRAESNPGTSRHATDRLR